MTEPLPDTWHSRDLPVLRAAVSILDATGEGPDTRELQQATGLSIEDIERAVRALDRGGYAEGNISLDFDGGYVEGIKDVSREAYQLAGAWPSPDSVADHLISALRDVAEHGSDPVEKAKARKAAEALGGLGRDLLVSVAGAAAGVAMQ